LSKDKLLNTLLFLLSLSFLAFYFLLAYYTRFSEEDYDLLISFGKNGWFGTLKYYYLNWSCRWASLSYFYLWFGHVKSYAGLRFLVFIYSCFSISALIYLVFKIATAGIQYVAFGASVSPDLHITSGLPLDSKVPSVLTRFNISILFCAALFFFMFQTSEVFFWVIASFDQVQPLIFFCLLLLMIIKKRTRLLDYFLILASGLYIGGSSEIFAILLFALIALFYLFLLFRKRFGVFMKSIPGKKIRIGFLSLTVSLAFALSAPGTYNRKIYESQHAAVVMNLRDASPIHDHLIWADILTQRKNGMTLALIFALFFSLNLLTGEKTKKFFSKKNVLFISALILLFSLAVFTIGFHSIFLNGTGPERAWAPFNFVALPCICIWGWALILKLNFSDKVQSFYALVFVLLSVSLLNIYVFRQFPLARNYARAYDNSIRFFDSNERAKLPLAVPTPMPDPGMLVPNILREDQFRELGLKTD